MINHARTLLLNLPAPGYTPLRLPANLAPVYTTLFTGDAVTDALRADCYMRILHAPDLVKYVLALDGRYTYDTTARLDLAVDVKAIYLNLRHCIDTQALSTLFNPTGPYATTIAELNKLWRRSAEAYLEFGAGLLAYIYSLEQIRVTHA